MEKQQKKRSAKSVVSLLGVVVVSTYIGAWHAGKSSLENMIDQLKQTNANMNKVSFSDYKIGGFPFSYKITIENLSVTLRPALAKDALQKMIAQQYPFFSAKFDEPVLVAANLWSDQVSIQFPSHAILTDREQSQLKSETKNGEVLVQHDSINAKILLHALGVTQAQEVKAIDHLRRFSYKDEGNTTYTNNNAFYSSHEGVAFDIRYDEPQIDQVAASIFAEIKNMRQPKQNIDAAFMENPLLKNDPNAAFFKEAAGLFADFIKKREPLTLRFNVEYLGDRFNKGGAKTPENMQVTLHEFTLSDVFGAFTGKGELHSAAQGGTKPVVTGNFTAQMDNYQAVWNNYFDFGQQIYHLVKQNEGKLNKNGRRLPDVHYVDEMIPVARTQLYSFIDHFAAEGNGAMKLDIRKDDAAGELTINGKTGKELGQIAAPYFKPIAEKSAELERR